MVYRLYLSKTASAVLKILMKSTYKTGTYLCLAVAFFSLSGIFSAFSKVFLQLLRLEKEANSTLFLPWWPDFNGFGFVNIISIFKILDFGLDYRTHAIATLMCLLEGEFRRSQLKLPG